MGGGSSGTDQATTFSEYFFIVQVYVRVTLGGEINSEINFREEREMEEVGNQLIK